jgi:multidrug transporter EmrE-like cation transporter
MARALPIILFSVLCSSTAHLFLKKGATAVFVSEGLGAGPLAMRAFGSGWLWGGIALHGIALLTWVYALGKAELSFAYPFIALGFVLTAMFSWLFMNETLSPMRLGGMALICVGLLFVSRG